MSAAPLDFEPAAVLLDMDGLMVDSERIHMECWQQAARERGLEVDDAFWLSLAGLHEDDINELVHEKFGKAQAEWMIERCTALFEQQVDAGLPHKAGVVPLLELLVASQVTRAVVTSSKTERAWRKLETAGLRGYFDVVVSGSDIDEPKPAPDIYCLAARQLGVEPARCVVLEDSNPGVRAALAAGMHPIQVPDLLQPDEALRSRGYRIVGSLTEAAALLAPRLAAQGR